jgi:allantoate deiminase
VLSVLDRLDALAAITETPGSITRLYLTDAHRRAVSLLRGWMETACLATTLDDTATLIGRREGSVPGAPTLILGSHIDTVRDAGRYDGCLGVVAAIAAAARLRDSALPYALEVRAFGDEEGVRFPVTLTGARATAGIFDPASLAARDADGISLAEALRAWSLSPANLVSGTCKAANAFAYLELHIEQGPILDRLDLPLGVVTAINGAARFQVTLRGESGHAGTVPMTGRRDALVAASAVICDIAAIAEEHAPAVATVGQIAAHPGAVNVIPGVCSFTIDIRAPEDSLRHRVETDVLARIKTLAAARGVTADIVKTHEAAATSCDKRLQEALAACIAETGNALHYLPSGAGHDAMAGASLCPIGMLFLRCAGGISHHPAESVREDDVALAIDILCATLRRLDPSAFAQTRLTE